MKNLLFLLVLTPSLSFFRSTFVNKLKLVLDIDKSLGWKRTDNGVKIFLKFK